MPFLRLNTALNIGGTILKKLFTMWSESRFLGTRDQDRPENGNMKQAEALLSALANMYARNEN